jgi:hypothetical protein
MRRWLIAGVLAVAGGGCSLLSPHPAPEPTRTLLRPTCADVEQDACVAEAVTVNGRQLHLDELEYRSLDRRPVPVRCVLRETGLLEACHVLDSRGEELDARLVAALTPRRYQPVLYRGRPVLVPYTFLVSFSPPPSEAATTAAVRLEVFRALLQRLPRKAVDAGVQGVRPLVCVGIGDDVADPPSGELEALRRGGASVEPASSCWGLMQAVGGAAPFGSVVVRDVQMERPDVAQIRAEVGVSGQSPEFLSLRASRLGDRWLIEEQPAASPLDAGTLRPADRSP